MSEDIRIVALDATSWASPEDFHAALLVGLGTPAGSPLVDAVIAAEPPLRVEIANLHAAQEAAMDAVYAAFNALTLAGAKTRIGRDGIATIERPLPARP
ncbi:hypothetical protein [Sphingomonas immobilis]|uniref:Uncharacterized protein n=1 Tax=Sphingomonas immobilis TaxID=3063997 RepID=A0ABT9A2S0_9SPHN|nr:hypothetical protein [Sphingomonas sp. CA1-15]MDO7843530.1 hypothetical protein [Sphingomonas sp. CA1-15]